MFDGYLMYTAGRPARLYQQAGNPHITLCKKKGRNGTHPAFHLYSLIINLALAAGGGLEPPLPGPEPGVLPLDDPAENAPQN
jgi:hypothetical protein